MAVEKWRKLPSFVIYSYLKGSASTTTEIKGMESCILGMWIGYHLSKKGIRKGYLFCRKLYTKG